MNDTNCIAVVQALSHVSAKTFLVDTSVCKCHFQVFVCACHLQVIDRYGPARKYFTTGSEVCTQEKFPCIRRAVACVDETGFLQQVFGERFTEEALFSSG